MREMIIALLPILMPVFMGTILLFLKRLKERKVILIYTGTGLMLTGVLALNVILNATDRQVTLFWLTEQIPVMLKLDLLGRLFMLVVAVVWICAGFFSFSYMKHEKNERRYYGFYLITFGVLLGLGQSGNLVTMYAFYEFMTLAAFPLVIHNQSREAVMAGLKYLIYSFFGAYMALFGLFFLCGYADTIAFTPGGILSTEVIREHGQLLLIIAGLMILGFSVKAGMFPLHAWLPTAHPVAPAPASAVLSGIIVKGGVFAILRVVFYLFGADFLRGTWVQTVFLVLSLLTVLMGSMLAFGEDVLKKRLAYSTISQLSYILFGIALLEPTAVSGSLVHLIGHALIKSTLFLCAGAVICRSGLTKVSELRGIGKRMPVTIWCFTIASLGLIGIPPTCGFISKWYLATGSLDSGIAVFRYAGPIILIISALLTAGYLLPVTIKGFFPGVTSKEVEGERKETTYDTWKMCEGDGLMLIPLVMMTAFSVLLGMFPNIMLHYIDGILGGIL